MVKDIEKAELQLRMWFPLLSGQGSCIPNSNRDMNYNCIAWAMGLNDRWVDPDVSAGHWWFRQYENIENEITKEALIKAFEYMHFQECISNEPEKHYDKVALYCDEKYGLWTHAARVLSNGKYHSKAGNAWDFIHDGGKYSLNNPFDKKNSYGVVFQYMKRHKIMRVVSIFERIKLFNQKFRNEFCSWLW